MVKEKRTSTDDSIEVVEQTLSRTEQFIENNLKTILTVVVAVLIVVGGYYSFKSFYLKPLEEEARGKMFRAEASFAKDSFNLALRGAGENLGFLQVAEEYGMTETANLAHYYAGICYLRIGDFENAIEEFAKFNGKDIILTAKSVGLTGDAYVELKQLEKGADFYLKASKVNENSLTTPEYLMKAGQVYEELKNFKKAVEVYSEVKNPKFKQSQQYNMVDKYIARAKAKGNL